MRAFWLLAACMLLAGCAPRSSVPEEILEQARAQQPPEVPATLDAAAEQSQDLASLLRFPVRHFRNQNMSEASATALGRMGSAAVPSLLPLLDSPDPEIRLQATEVLARIGPEAGAAVPLLTQRLADPDERVRRGAARALGQIGTAAAPSIPYLIDAMVQPQPGPTP